MSLPISPMLVQYLVGLCCLKWTSEAVNVTLGDYVLDSAAHIERDVDVTVRVDGGNEGNFAFIGYEVKREAKPLDVAVIEQLSLKLKDMEEISHRAVVSTSGFTNAARAKARTHGVVLYELKPWTQPLKLQFPAFSEVEGNAEQMFMTERVLLTWVNHQCSATCPAATGEYSIAGSDPVFTKTGKSHRRYATFQDYLDEVFLRSTEVLLPLNPAQGVLNTFPIPIPPEGEIAAGPAWPHTHTLETSAEDIYVRISGEKIRIDRITISGQLQWQRHGKRALYYVMEEVETGIPFAGAIIFPEIRAGQMKVLVVSPESRRINIHFVQLHESQLNILRRIGVSRPE